jgi:hypothetical protein
MTVEIHAKLIPLLAEVGGLKSKEAQLKSEKARHLEQIAQSDGENNQTIGTPNESGMLGQSTRSRFDRVCGGSGWRTPRLNGPTIWSAMSHHMRVKDTIDRRNK